jgi:hypothetical protein
MDGMPHAELNGGDTEVMSVSLMKKEALVLLPDDWNFLQCFKHKTSLEQRAWGLTIKQKLLVFK